PEMAGGAKADSISDQYSLGCLLWQLLAGRAPFPTGDPHGKVGAHRSKAVPDICDVAPQVSQMLGRVVRKLTSKTRSERFASFRELAIQLGGAAQQDRRQLAKFFRTFETDAPTQTARIPTEKTKQLPGALAAVVIGGATVWLFTSDPASFSERSRKRAESVAPKPLPASGEARPIASQPAHSDSSIVQTAGIRSGSAVLPLPLPDAAGIISLTSGAAYLPRAIKVSGPVVIRASGEAPARITIQEAAWEIVADLVRFENVQLDCLAPIRVQSRGVEVQHSVLTGAGDLSAMEWRPQDAAAVAPGTLLIADSHVSGGGWNCAVRPSQVRIVNCLKTGGGAMLRLPSVGRAHQATPVQVIHTTLRGAGPLLEWSPGSRALGLKVDLTTKACLFAPESGAPLLALQGSLAPPEWERTITVKGLESLLLNSAKIVDLTPARGKPRGTIDLRNLEVDGVMAAAIEFFGPNGEDAASSALRSTDATFSVDNPPGIDAAKVATLKRP
ncbi:MAG TPA: hypothetical protein VM510_12085, partial [Caulifigura sp.]|nr:hypothetical protein [Caulifigura sp.]